MELLQRELTYELLEIRTDDILAIQVSRDGDLEIVKGSCANSPTIYTETS